MEEELRKCPPGLRAPKSRKEKVCLRERSKFKGTQCKNNWAVDVFRNWEAARKIKFPFLAPGRVFNDYDVSVQNFFWTAFP